MSIFANLRQMRELGRLRRTARQNPSPSSIADLAERYIALGRIEDAFKTAELGLTHYPTSERLTSIRTFARRQRYQADIKRLRIEMTDRPSPTVYGQLAEIYRDLDNLETALQICDQCIEKFPLNENPYLIIGEVRLSRFFQDLIGHDGIEAVKQLKRVTKLNNQNIKAHLLLGQFYYAIGAVDELAKTLDEVRALSPGHREVERFVKDIAVRPPELPANPILPEEDEDDLEQDLSIPGLLEAVEKQGALPNDPRHFPAGRFRGSPAVAVQQARLNVANLKAGLGEISGQSGIRNALILDRDGEPIADASDPDSLTRNQFSELMQEILGTSEDASRRMDVGTLRWCTIEGAFGGVTITKVKNIAMGVNYDPSVKPADARTMLAEFAARNFTAPLEASHA